MRTCLLALLGILLTSQLLFAQNEQVKLLVQSPDGKNVKLVWFLLSGNKDITGFDIKRKEGLQDWVKLNTEPIIPGVSMKRSFLALGATKGEESVLKSHLYKHLASRKLKETDAQYLQKLLGDDKMLQEVSKKIAADYELALMHGFAYLDHTITKKTDYQYGLFVQGTNQLLAKVTWNYGEIADLNTIQEITSRATAGTSGVHVIWNASLSKMQNASVAGFNIYRQGIRLNSNPITSSNPTDLSEFSWFDRSASSSVPIQYSISAESIFGIEGIIKSYTYDPADHPARYAKAEVIDVNSLGYYFKDGISVKWTFPKEYERFIKGFYVEKENMPNGFSRISTLLEPATRSFVDKTPSPTSVYLRFQVVAVYNDRTLEPGIERLYSYFPITEPPRPLNLYADIPATDKKIMIGLHWNKQIAGDSITDHYKVYINEPGSERFTLINENFPVKGNKYVYRVPDGISKVYRFYITAASKVGTESIPSDTVSMQTPSSELPIPIITKAVSDSVKITVQWQYPEISDLKGFILLLNNKVIAGEKELKKNTRQFVVIKSEPGNNTFTLKAISEGGGVSEISSPVSVTIPAGTK
ncbi:MAG: hypothetical protein K0Q79_1603 [Flavipsychrobacter sp.]|jgi:hypothetical protein|nr:hypothetical protein [Flavipsychrobacter sp.]